MTNPYLSSSRGRNPYLRGESRPRSESSPFNEDEFRRWYTRHATSAGIDPDPDNPLHKYDYRAAYRAGYEPEMGPDGLMHWPSEFKSDDHPNRFVGGMDTKYGKPVAETRPSFWQNALDFSETRDVVRGLSRSAASVLTHPGEGLARLTAFGAEKIGADKVADVARDAAESLKRQREDYNALLGERRSNYELGGEIAGNIVANIAGGDVYGSAVAAADPEYASAGLAAQMLRSGEPGAARRTAASVFEAANESAVGRGVSEFLLSKITGGAIRKGGEAIAARRARPGAAGVVAAADDLPVPEMKRLPPGQYEMPGDSPDRAVREEMGRVFGGAGRQVPPAPERLALPPRRIEMPGESPARRAVQAKIEDVAARGTRALPPAREPLALPPAGGTSGPRPMPPKTESTLRAERAAFDEALERNPYRRAMLNRAEREGAAEAAEEAPETIVTAAVELPSGGYATGPVHAFAWQKAVDAGEVPIGFEDWNSIPDHWNGFMTSRGRFVSREEAYEIAERADDLTKGARRQVDEPVRPRPLVAEELEGVGDRVVYNRETGRFDDSGAPEMRYSGASTEALRKLAATQEGRGLAVAGAGALLSENDDEQLAATGNGLIALGVLSAVGSARISSAARAGGQRITDALKSNPLGVKALNAISYDILAAPEVKAAVEAYTEEVSKGGARAARVARLTDNLTPSMDRAVSDIIEGEAFESAARFSPQEAQAIAGIARQISDEFTELGRAKVDAGVLSRATVAKREGKYLPRFYGEFLGAEGERIPESVTAGGKKIRIRGDKARLDDLSPEIRNELGEIREASFRASVGLDKGYRDVAAARLFTALRQMPGVVHPDVAEAADHLLQARAFAATASAADRDVAREAVRQAERALKSIEASPGYKKMPDTPGMGALRGAVIREDVADYLNGVPAMQGAFGKALSVWKKIHTVYNPGTHVGNFASNLVKYHMAGMPLTEQPNAIMRASRSLSKFDADVQFMAERGALNRNYAFAGEGKPIVGKSTKRALKEIAGSSRPETRAALEGAGVKPMTAAERAARRADDRITQAYAWEDNVFAVAMFQKLVKQGVSRDDAVRQMASLNDFSTRSPLLGAVRDLASPFVLFTAKEAPRLLKNIVDHPVRWMTLAAIWGGMDQYSRRAVGAVRQEDLRPDQRASRFGYLAPGTVQLPFSNERGDKAVVDVGRWTPLGALTGAPAPGAVGTQISPEFPPLLNPSGPITDAGALVANTDSFTGDKLLTPGMSRGEQIATLLRAMSKFVLPSAASFHVPRVVGDLRSGDTQAAATDALGLIGSRPSFVRPGMQTAREIRRYQEAQTEIRSDLRSALRRAKSPAAQERARAQAVKSLRRIATEFGEKHRR